MLEPDTEIQISNPPALDRIHAAVIPQGMTP